MLNICWSDIMWWIISLALLFVTSQLQDGTSWSHFCTFIILKGWYLHLMFIAMIQLTVFLTNVSLAIYTQFIPLYCLYSHFFFVNFFFLFVVCCGCKQPWVVFVNYSLPYPATIQKAMGLKWTTTYAFSSHPIFSSWFWIVKGRYKNNNKN